MIQQRRSCQERQESKDFEKECLVSPEDEVGVRIQHALCPSHNTKSVPSFFSQTTKATEHVLVVNRFKNFDLQFIRHQRSVECAGCWFVAVRVFSWFALDRHLQFVPAGSNLDGVAERR